MLTSDLTQVFYLPSESEKCIKRLILNKGKKHISPALRISVNAGEYIKNTTTQKLHNYQTNVCNLIDNLLYHQNRI